MSVLENSNLQSLLDSNNDSYLMPSSPPRHQVGVSSHVKSEPDSESHHSWINDEPVSSAELPFEKNSKSPYIQERSSSIAQDREKIDLTGAISDRENHTLPGNPQRCEWDLFVERIVPSFDNTKALKTLQNLRDIIDGSRIVTKRKRSYVLQNPEKHTWGTMVNEDLARIFEREGPEALKVSGDDSSKPPNWTQTILGLRSKQFGCCRCGNDETHYRGRLGDYIVTINEADYKRLESHCTSDIPTRSDWQSELDETRKRRKLITEFQTEAVKDLQTLARDLEYREEQISKQLIIPSSLFPKCYLPPERCFEDIEGKSDKLREGLNHDDYQRGRKLRDERCPLAPGKHLCRDEVPPSVEREDYDMGAARDAASSEKNAGFKSPSGGRMILRSRKDKGLSLPCGGITFEQSVLAPAALPTLTGDQSTPVKSGIAISTVRNFIPRSELEEAEGFDYVDKLRRQNTEWNMIAQLYKLDFMVERTPAAIKGYYWTEQRRRAKTTGRTEFSVEKKKSLRGHEKK